MQPWDSRASIWEAVKIMTFSIPYMGVSQNQGYLIGGPHSKDYSILGSIFGSPYFGKLAYNAV